MTSPARPRVLCVDDERHVLDGFSRVLRSEFEVVPAAGGVAALHAMQGALPRFAVVLSDMRMPGMNGVAVLAAARRLVPDATRVLLTGQADVKAAIAVVNEAQIFRFLTKPCRPEELLATLRQAAEQHHLLLAQRELLTHTLTGSVQALIEMLALTNPIGYGRALRARQLIADLATLIGFRDRWQMEMAAMISQIGVPVLPPDLGARYAAGDPLSDEEEVEVARLPLLALRVLGTLPRLDEIRAILTHLNDRYDAAASPAIEEHHPLGARLLRAVLDFDRLRSGGMNDADCLATMRGRADRYDPDVLVDLARVAHSEAPDSSCEMRLRDVPVGMIFASDVRMEDGTLLIARGQESTEGLLERIERYWSHLESQPVRVMWPAAQPAELPQRQAP